MAKPRPKKGRLALVLAEAINFAGIKQVEAAKRCKISPGYINQLLAGTRRDPALTVANQISKGLDIPLNVLAKAAIIDPGISIVGHVAAGKLNIAFTHGQPPEGSGFDFIDRPDWVKDKNAYAVMVRGDSMTPVLNEHDVVVVDTTAQLINGDKAVVQVKGGEAYLKIYRKQDGVISLESINPGQPTMVFQFDEVLAAHKVKLIRPR
jgi:phage repressor protein C with HTH and peptisase S24 domain